ncbi:MAG: aminotransferase class IV [Thermoanaerobaculia bacterium]
MGAYRAEDLPDPRNADIQVWVGGRLVPRLEATVSVFDSAVQGGDAVWEGLRVYDGRVAMLDAHLDRLTASARAMGFVEIPDRDTVRQALFRTLEVNGMRDDAHVRLTLTRGEKVTSGMDPRLNRAGPTLIVLAEWKPPVYPEKGIRLVTSAIRRAAPDILDSKIHHNNLIHNILAKLQANQAGADDALMLDREGYVAETNATNVFLAKRGTLVTPTADSCLPGITRGVVLALAREHGIAAEQRRVTLAEVWSADEMFTSGTMGELTPVLEVDGRTMGDGSPGPVTLRLRDLYREHARATGTPLPF